MHSYHLLTNKLIFLGEYSCLQVNLKFVRQLSFFVVTIYVPCTITVSVSWMSFWIDHKAVSNFSSLPECMYCVTITRIFKSFSKFNDPRKPTCFDLLCLQSLEIS